MIFRPSEACAGFALIESGRIRVQRQSASGREILLYHLGADEPCGLTLSALIGAAGEPAEVLATYAGLAGDLGAAREVMSRQ